VVVPFGERTLFFGGEVVDLVGLHELAPDFSMIEERFDVFEWFAELPDAGGHRPPQIVQDEVRQ
jgi:hypothetical protein